MLLESPTLASFILETMSVFIVCVISVEGQNRAAQFGEKNLTYTKIENL